ncbi:MAG: hypothetical protein QE487_00695 [Fluviicola sp.]|nr:hypothetical protein [Fluviicola sp.]
MKANLFLLVLSLFSCYSYSQELEFSFVHTSETKSKSYNTTNEQYAEILVVSSDSITERPVFDVMLVFFTSSEKDVRLTTTSFSVPKDFFIDSTIIKIYYNLIDDTLNPDKTDESFVLAVNLNDNTIYDTISVEKAEKPTFEKIDNPILGSLTDSDTVDVGTFYLMDDLNVTVTARFCKSKKKARKEARKENGKSEKKSDIRLHLKSVWLNVENGRIQKIHAITTNNDLFVNTGPISVTCLEGHEHDKLFYVGTKNELESYYLVLGDLIYYADLTSRVTFPSDGIIMLDENHKKDTVRFTSSPIDFFDIRTYTDTKALGGEANGLVQTEANLRFIGSTNLGQRYFLFFPYVNLNFSYSKFDSKFDSLEQITSFNNRENNQLLSLIQQSTIGFRVEAEVFRYSRVHDFFLNIGHQFYFTHVKTLDSAGNVFTPSFYATAGGTMFSFPRIRCNFKFPFMLSYLQDQPFREYKRNVDFLIIPEIELIVDPLRKKNGSRSKTNNTESGVSIFGRLRYFDMPDYRGNNFWQIQFGVQIPLTEALGLK